MIIRSVWEFTLVSSTYSLRKSFTTFNKGKNTRGPDYPGRLVKVKPEYNKIDCSLNLSCQ